MRSPSQGQDLGITPAHGIAQWQLIAWGHPESIIVPHFTGRRGAELRALLSAGDSDPELGCCDPRAAPSCDVSV